MTAYYNEIDPYAAQWLRNLIAAGHIAPGDVDERSIVDVRPGDLAGYEQCHAAMRTRVFGHRGGGRTRAQPATERSGPYERGDGELADADGGDARAERQQRGGQHGQQPQDGSTSWPTPTVHDPMRGGQAKRAAGATRHGSNLQDFALLVGPHRKRTT